MKQAGEKNEEKKTVFLFRGVREVEHGTRRKGG